MSHIELKPKAVGQFAVGCVVGSLLCAALVVIFPGIDGLFSPFGFIAACIGAGVALWCSIRLREHLCYLALVLSIPNVVVWAWLINHIIYEKSA